jgi:hypothetical protein
MRYIALAFLFAVAACSSQKPASPPSSLNTNAPDPYANGRSIFMSGVDLAGHRISAFPKPLHPACADCHLPSGTGGLHFAEAHAVSADLRHKALVLDQKHPYTVALLERAISTGIDNEGEKLNPVMPRWKMSQKDLHDVAQYVYNRLK